MAEQTPPQNTFQNEENMNYTEEEMMMFQQQQLEYQKQLYLWQQQQQEQWRLLQEMINKPTYMFEQVTDPKSGQPIWILKENYFNELLSEYKFIDVLREQENHKWTPEEKHEYERFLNDYQFTLHQALYENKVNDYAVFKEGIAIYNEKNNPIGAKCYANQKKYWEKKYLTKEELEELKKKEGTLRPTQEKARPLPAIKPEKVVLIRAEDPPIDIEALRMKEWGENYVSKSEFLKENANIVFVGHVDSGKSTLTGIILKELNEVDEQEWLRGKQEVKENKMEAWELASISDVAPEERIDGKTREYAKLAFSLESRRFTLIDAPGHRNYVPNMMSGACQADIAVLIISAKDGEFESGFEKDGQTKEHAILARALGASHLIVAVTKMATVNWDKARFKHIEDQVSPFLLETCGYKNVQFIPIDSLTNMNIHRPANIEWYKGDYLLHALEVIPIPARNPNYPLRMSIIDKFKETNTLYIYGKVESGTIKEDQIVTLLPSRIQITCKEFYNAKDKRIPFATAGENVKIKVKNIDENDINRGDVICNNQDYCQESFEFKAKLKIVEIPEKKKLMATGYQCVMHMHSIKEEVEVTVLKKYLPKENIYIPIKFLVTGDTGTVVIKSKKEICIEKYSIMPAFGRFTLRDEEKTIGYGEVELIKPAKSLEKEQEDRLRGTNLTAEITAKVENLTV